jgi:propionyl-CoA synthetase
MPGPGFRVAILSGDNQPLPACQLGKICIRLPLPPSFMATIYNNDG